ncbi:MAG: SUF system Fe-S cluster assembly regulator [Planctomycetota bacterium]|jgi:FeS assembly SUF system regulator
MLRITRQTDYGIVLMSLFTGKNESAILSARDMSKETNLPLPTVSKILKSLTRGGLLESTRGVKGGYSLAKPSNDISVSDIIEAIEGPIALTDCVDQTNRDCLIEESCPCKSNWLRINMAVKAALETIPLEQMTAGCKFVFPDGTPEGESAGSDLPNDGSNDELA